MSDTATTTSTELQIKLPSMWKVMLFNDDFTPMDFVVLVLQQIFNKASDEAHQLMMTVHESGRVNVGLYTKEVALTKVQQVKVAADRYQHPLLATAEEA